MSSSAQLRVEKVCIGRTNVTVNPKETLPLAGSNNTCNQIFARHLQGSFSLLLVCLTLKDV